jgi:uncharacterized protein (DUF433 family)
MLSFLTAIAERLERPVAVRALVTSSPEVLGGTPVIIGTRIPVHDVAASRAAGHPLEAILSAYPRLTAEQVDLATLYAEAYPLRGRPCLAALSEEAILIADRRVSRRSLPAGQG